MLTAIVFAENYFSQVVVDSRMHSVSLRELDGLDSVVMFGFAVGPTPPVRTYHIGSVPDRSEGKSIVLGLHDLSMAESQS